VEKHGAKVTSLKIPATVIVNKLKKYVDSAVEKMVYKNADCFQEECREIHGNLHAILK
jgi:hypothetical protein